MKHDGGGVTYLYARARQLEGTYPRDSGAFGITCMRVTFGWGTILDDAWPDASPYSQEPPGLDELAKKLRTRLYFRIQDLGGVRRCLAKGPKYLVSAVVPVTHDWFSALGGRIPLPKPSAPMIANHVIPIYGYDNRTRLLEFANSWGREWGSDGWGSIPYAYLDKYLQEAWSAEFNCMPLNQDFDDMKPGINELSWGRWSPLGPIHGLELYDADADDRLAWALVLEDRDRLELQDLFVKPAYRRKGHGNALVRQIARLARKLRLPLLLPVHPVDVRLFETPIRKLARTLGISLAPGKRPWAPLLGRYLV
jgi:GNAT superfamily N-acetyltransferase